MSRFIAFGVLRRDFQVLATGEDEQEVSDIAETAVRSGLMTEAFVLSAEKSFVQGIVEPLPPPAPAPEVPIPPLNLSPHTDLSTDQVLGGQFMRDVNEGMKTGGNLTGDPAGRTEVVDTGEPEPIDSTSRPLADPATQAEAQ